MIVSVNQLKNKVQHSSRWLLYLLELYRYRFVWIDDQNISSVSSISSRIKFWPKKNLGSSSIFKQKNFYWIPQEFVLMRYIWLLDFYLKFYWFSNKRLILFFYFWLDTHQKNELQNIFRKKLFELLLDCTLCILLECSHSKETQLSRLASRKLMECDYGAFAAESLWNCGGKFLESQDIIR
jgi:hypothetical protein